MSLNLVEYYRDIIPDVDAFAAVLDTDLPYTFWVNTLKTTSAKVLQYLADLGIAAEPIAWHPNAFRTTSSKLGSSWPYLLGLIQIQEEVSMLPGVLLAAQPGETVLDLCAAPGNKTAQAAVAMQNQGVLVANDNDFSRMRAMGQIKKRLGLMNLSMSVYDAMKYPGLKNQFDRVLVDAPCSCEGTLRKSSRAEFKPSRHFALKMAHRQFLILQKAFQLCKPGGRIVYSTCTFAPEENERVVHQLLVAVGDQVRVLPIALTDFQFSPGIAEWCNERFDPQLKNTMRVWPHQNNTGGFFVAVLEKNRHCERSAAISRNDVHSSVMARSASDPAPSLRGLREECTWIKQSISNEALKARFGFTDALFDDFYFVDSAKGFYIVPNSARPPAGIPYDATGLFFLKTRIEFPKLSTEAAMMFAKYATRNVITLDKAQFAAYLNREEFVLSQNQIINCDGTGYVILCYAGEAVGMGLYFTARDSLPPRCRSLLPKYLHPKAQHSHQR